MVRAVHALAGDVPSGYPLPACDEFPWWRFDELLAEVGDLVDAAALAGLEATIERHRGWRQWVDGVVCHGDVHPGNVVMTAAGPVLLDWDLLCLGPPGWDHAMLLRLPRWGWPAGWYDEFAAGYGRSLADDPTAEALAELRLVAATLMRLRAARDRPGGDARGPAPPGVLARRPRRSDVDRCVIPSECLLRPSTRVCRRPDRREHSDRA